MLREPYARVLTMPWDELLLCVDTAQAIEDDEGIGRQLAAALGQM